MKTHLRKSGKIGVPTRYFPVDEHAFYKHNYYVRLECVCVRKFASLPSEGQMSLTVCIVTCPFSSLLKVATMILKILLSVA